MVTVSEIMQRDYLRLEWDDSITTVFGKLAKADERYGLVFDKKFKEPYRGVLDRFKLVESKLNQAAKIEHFISNPPTIAPDADVFKAAELMYHAYPCVLPVIKKGKILGVVRARDILSLLPKTPALAKLRCSEIATPSPVTFMEDARLGNVINILKEKRISHVPITDKSGNLISTFSLTDLYKHYFTVPEEKMKGSSKTLSTKGGKGTFSGPRVFITRKNFTMDSSIGSFASLPQFTASPSEPLGRAVADMAEHKVSDLVVVENRKPTGRITTRDLLESFFRMRAPEYWSITFMGCEQLPGQLYDSIRNQVAEFYEKIKRTYFQNQVIRYFLVHIKLYEPKPTKHVKYSIHLRLAMPFKTFSVEEVHFDPNTAVSWAIKAMDQMLLRFREKGKKSWTTTSKKGKRLEFGREKRREIEEKGKIMRQKLVKRK